MTHKEKVLALLSDGRPHTHHELYALGCIAHSRITNLRNDGHAIECWRDGDFYMYRLASLEESVPSSLRNADGEARAGDVGTDSLSEAWPLAAAPPESSPPGTPASLTLFEDVAA